MQRPFGVAESGLVLPGVLAADHLREVLAVLTVGVVVDGPVLQSVLCTGQLHHLLIDGLAAPSGTQINETNVVITIIRIGF